MTLYDSSRWRQLRLAQLTAEPWCRYCAAQGHKVPASIVDHICRHRGDPALFFDPRNLQSLCKTCHNSAKQRLEKSGYLRGVDQFGLPQDPSHHWNLS